LSLIDRRLLRGIKPTKVPLVDLYGSPATLSDTFNIAANNQSTAPSSATTDIVTAYYIAITIATIDHVAPAGPDEAFTLSRRKSYLVCVA
jgi:hypothetical protein